MTIENTGAIDIHFGMNVNSHDPIDANTRFASMAEAMAYEWKKVGVPVFIDGAHYFWDGTAFAPFPSSETGAIVRAVEIVSVVPDVSDPNVRRATVQLYDAKGELTQTTLTNVKVVGSAEEAATLAGLSGLLAGLSNTIG